MLQKSVHLNHNFIGLVSGGISKQHDKESSKGPDGLGSGEDESSEASEGHHKTTNIASETTDSTTADPLAKKTKAVVTKKTPATKAAKVTKATKPPPTKPTKPTKATKAPKVKNP